MSAFKQMVREALREVARQTELEESVAVGTDDGVDVHIVSTSLGGGGRKFHAVTQKGQRWIDANLEDEDDRVKSWYNDFVIIHDRAWQKLKRDMDSAGLKTQVNT